MYFSLLLHTISHLRLIQAFYRLKYRLIKSTYKTMCEPNLLKGCFKIDYIPKYQCYKEGVFSFLNLEHRFADWNFSEYGDLWTYNLNYFDWLNQEDIEGQLCNKTEKSEWIDKFIVDVISSKINMGMSMDSYTISLRSINWIKFFCKYPEFATKERLDSLYSQVRLLACRLEYHLLGNHLLENLYSLYIASVYYNDEKLFSKSWKLLKEQLNEQILSDGAHYEQSPMYHCILLDRLLDCINIRPTDFLRSMACKMLGHLESVIWKDETIPLLNDSAYRIAPSPSQLFKYARQLGLKWKPLPLKECGYRKYENANMEAIVDVGNITASYQPGHSHADTFNYELRVDGVPLVVDTGISTYEKNSRRQYERSTVAHNTVTVGDKDSSEVWGGFRVGKRATVNILCEGENMITACHNGYSKLCKRSFMMDSSGFSVIDSLSGMAVSRIHVAMDCSLEKNDIVYVVSTPLANIVIEDAIDVKLEKAKASLEYNKLYEVTEVVISFKDSLRYKIISE